MNHVENIRAKQSALGNAYTEYGNTIQEAMDWCVSQIKPLEDELAIWRRMKTDPACVRVNMLRGEIAMLTEVERFHELQTEVERLTYKVMKCNGELDEQDAEIKSMKEKITALSDEVEIWRRRCIEAEEK